MVFNGLGKIDLGAAQASRLGKAKPVIPIGN